MNATRVSQNTAEPQKLNNRMLKRHRNLMLEPYDKMLQKAEKDVFKNQDEYLPRDVEVEGLSDKQYEVLAKRIMSAFEALTPKQQEEYVEAAIKFLANA